MVWQASSDANVAGYFVYAGTTPGVYSVKTNVGLATSATLGGLEEGKTYCFTATTYNSSGTESDLSNQLSYSVPNEPPTLDELPPITIVEDGGSQPVLLSGISSGKSTEAQSLSISAVSDNPSLLPNPTVVYTSPNPSGTLLLNPAPNANGSCLVTVTVSDGSDVVSRTFGVIITSVNDPPTLANLTSLTINENASVQTVPLTGIGTGAPDEVQALSVTAVSSNPGLIPNPTVIYSSPATTGSLSFAPLPYANGSAVITVTVSEGGPSNSSTSRSFTVTVNPVNQAPTLSPIANFSVPEGAPSQSVLLTGITSGATNEFQTLTVTATSSNPGLVPTPTIAYTSPATTATLSFTPVLYASGIATITIVVNDGMATTAQSFQVLVSAVNQAPTLNLINPLTIDEDSGLRTLAISGITTGATNEFQTLVITAVSSNPGLIPNPAVAYTSPNSTGSLSFTPKADASGSATITVTVDDGVDATSRSFLVTVNPINDPPTLAPLSNLTIAENSGPQTVPLSGINSGAADENQALSVTATSSNPGLIPAPSVSYVSPNASGSLTLAPVLYGNGTATITVTVSDGAAVTSRSFVVTVTAVNQAPTLAVLEAITVNEDSGARTISLSGISTGATNELQTLAVTAVSSNPGLIPNPTVSYTSPAATGFITMTPALNGSGSATVTVTVSDGMDTISRSFPVTVLPINDAPTLNPLSNLTIPEGAGVQTVSLTGISSGALNEDQALTITAVSSNPEVIPHPIVSYTTPAATGSLSFAPVAYASGSATITVTVSDGQPVNQVVIRNFTITVTPVNQAPTLSPIGNLVLLENAGTQTVALGGITSGATNEFQNLTVTATSSNPSLIPTPSISYVSPNSSGTLTFAPLAFASGLATITVAVTDGEASASQSFQVQVNAVNQPPTLSPILSFTLNEDSGTRLVSLAGITTGATNEFQTLTVTASSSNPGLIPAPVVTYTSPGTAGTLALTPAANASGAATITVTVSDGLDSISQTFNVTVDPVNDPPTLLGISSLILDENAGLQTVPLSGISSGAPNETQPLVVRAVSSNPGLIPNPTVNYVSPQSSGTLTFTPTPFANGSARITVTVEDGQPTNNSFSREFTVNVNPVNQAPTLDAIADVQFNENDSARTLTFTGVSPGATNEVEELSIIATSSNPTLIPVPTITYTSPSDRGTLALTPQPGRSGTAQITLTVRDSQNAVTTRSFAVRVNGLPYISGSTNVLLVKGAVSDPMPITVGDDESPADTLTVFAESLNSSLLPRSGIQITGAGADRTIRLSPETNEVGTATVRLAVSDGQATNYTDFLLTVQAAVVRPPPNSAPGISQIADVSAPVNTGVPSITFTVWDLESSASNLITVAQSSNPALLAPTQMQVGGSGSNRWLIVSPTMDAVGTADIAVIVSDGLAETRTNFTLTIAPKSVAKLSVRKLGRGKITPETGEKSLPTGKTYKLTAVPDAGYEFAGWTGSLTSSSPILTFTLRDDMVLNANFILNPFIAAQGVYSGLFHEEQTVRHESSGDFRLTVTSKGLYSGKFRLGAANLTLTGKLTADCRGSNTVARLNASPITIRFQLGTGPLQNQVFGSVWDTSWTAGLYGDRLVYHLKTNVAPAAGNYTIVFPGASEGSPAPVGHGYGSVRVGANGLIMMLGTLSDGTRFTQSAYLSPRSQWPLYSVLYLGTGSMISWMDFANKPESDLTGDVVWTKPANPRNVFYPGGFRHEAAAVGSLFNRPIYPAGHILSSTDARIHFHGGNLEAPFANDISFGPSDRVVNLSSNRLNLVVSTSGLFTGTVVEPGSGRMRTYGGAILQKLQAGYGLALGTNQTTGVFLEPLR